MSETSPQRSRWPRRVAWGLVALVAVAVLIVIGLEVAVRQPSVQRAVIQRVDREVAERTGLSLKMDTLRASLLTGRVEIDGLSLGSPGETPILSARHIEAAWRLSSIWEKSLTLKRLIITEPSLDLGAPAPSLRDASEQGDSAFVLAVEHFEAVDGRIDGPILTSELRSWIEEWWLEDLRILGWYDLRGLDLELESQLLWQRSDGERVEVSVDGKLEGPRDGPWSLTRMSLRGPGLEADLSASVGAAWMDSVEADFETQFEPHLLIPVPPTRGPVSARGRFDTARKTGNLHLGALGLPVELISPWLDEDSKDNALLQGWSLDVDTDLELGGKSSGLDGTGRLRLARQEDTWATGDLELSSAMESGGVEAQVEGLLLPDLPGQRSVRARLQAPEWAQIDQLTLEDGEIEVMASNLADLREKVAAIWPEPLPEGVSRALVGRLDATADLAGTREDPQLDLKAYWSHGETSNIELRGTAAADRVILESVKGRLGERRFSGRGQVDLPMPITRAQAQVEISDLLPEIPRVDLALDLANGVASVDAQTEISNGVTSRFTGEVPLASLGDLPELHEALSALPLVQAEGPVRLDWQVPEAQWADWVSPYIEEPQLASLRFGSRGSVTFDPSRPLAGSGRMVVGPLEIATEDLAVAAETPIQIRLERGQVILEAARLKTEGGVLEVEAWSELASRWQSGDPIKDLVQRFQMEANGFAPVALLQSVVDDIYTDGDLEVALSVSGTPEDLNGEIRINGPQAELRAGDPEGVRLSNPSVEIAFEGDRLRVHRASVEIDEGEILVTGEIPIATLQSWRESDPGARDRPQEPLALQFEVPQADWAATLSRLGVERPPESLVMAGRGELILDPQRPLDAAGWLEISPLTVSIESHEVRNDGPLRVEFEDGRLDLTALNFLADDQPFGLAGSLGLDRTWTPELSYQSLVESLEVRGQGTLDAVLLNPFLAGGSGDGPLQVDLEIKGTLEEPMGRLQLRGSEASILFVAPYVAKIEAPELDLELVDGRAQVRDGRLRLNGGDVELDGSLGLDGANLFAAFDGLRFRLDHGLLARVDGALNLAVDREGRGRLTGEIIVDQGSLTRPISIDRDFLTDLLSPIDLTGTEESLLEQIELDLTLTTRRGVQVRNNVASLAVQWDEVRVRGNLLQPVLEGQFRVEPGGRAFLFGQTLRIDRGVMTFPGQAGAEAILDLETTSSLDDPTISQLAGDEVLSLGAGDPAEDLESRAREAGWSAAAFVSEQVATRIADAIPAARLTFRPILIFGEADPGARLTIGRDFSRYVTLAASIDLRNAERQTYLMDAHNIPRLPGLVVQVFTNDMEQEGFTLQHRLRFGGYRRTAPTGPNLRRVTIDEVPGISKRALRRSIGLAKGDRASADDVFLAEVEVGEFMRSRGYPDARVEVHSRPAPERAQKVDLEVSIEPGPLVHFEFTGEEFPRALQRSITPLYRSDFYEPMALAEMETQTVRALRSLGFLYPLVQIHVEMGQDAEGREERTVSIFSIGGDQASLETLDLDGLSEEDADEVRGIFSTRLRRVELATAESSADRRLLTALQGLGHPEPEILDRQVSEDGRDLRVTVLPGPLQHLTTVAVEGVDPGEALDLVRAAGVAEGEVARRDRIAGGALAIESELRSQGFVNARVRPRLEAGEVGIEGDVSLTFEVEPGAAYTVAATEVSGLRSTSRRWATNVAEMESGAPLRENEVAAARSRLYETGLFTMVRSDSFLTEGGQTEVVFDVEERPRFSTAYGLRWDSDEGTQGVVDVIDQNSLGRSVTLGLRALYKTDDWSVRLGAGVPRLFGSRAVLEVFGSYRERFEEIEEEFFIVQDDRKALETSLQVAYPFGRNLSGRFYGRYRTVDQVLADIDKDPDPDFPFPPIVLELSFKTPLLGTLWIYDTRDRELVLNRGIFASLDLSGTGEAINSDFEYVRMFSQFNLYRPFRQWAGRRLSWAQSLRLGVADSFDQELDRDDRFFAGGQYSVRGYPTDSLGPVEVLGDLVRPLGGKTLVVINEELRFDLLGPVAGLLFFDLGNVWEDTAEFGSDLFKSVGLGFRAVTPVGLLRLDLAFPLDRRENDPSSKIYFGFGNTF